VVAKLNCTKPARLFEDACKSSPRASCYSGVSSSRKVFILSLVFIHQDVGYYVKLLQITLKVLGHVNCQYCEGVQFHSVVTREDLLY